MLMTCRRSGSVSLVLVGALLGACGDPAAGGETTGGSSTGDTSGEAPTGGPGTTQEPTSVGVTETGGTMGGTQGETGETTTTTTGEPATTDATTADTTDTGEPPPSFGRCGDEPPPGAVLAPEIPKYAGACPILETGYMDGQPANILPQTVSLVNFERSFLVIVPDDMQPDETLPVMFMWHWLGGSSKDFYERADAQEAVNEKRFIAVIPDGREAEQGVLFKWPFSIIDPDESLEADFQLFDDMLSCVAEQFAVDKDCVGSVGVSAGALFTSQLAGGRGDRLSSFLSLSGGTGGSVVKGWKEPAHKMPALVLWGGDGDFCIAVDFKQTSQDLEKHLVEGGHFVEECIHNCNHSTPPFDVPDGMTDFAPLWDFLFDHPYWLKPGESPYNELGLPPSMPSWCAVGVGNATPPPEKCDTNECS
jgi:predicted esterase